MKLFAEITISGVITLLSILAAILAWLAKLRWSKEYAAAKDETIRAKDAQIDALKQQIENLKDLTPNKLREYFESTRTSLEEYIEKLKIQLREAKDKTSQKSQQITNLEDKGQTADRMSTISKLMKEELMTLRNSDWQFLASGKTFTEVVEELTPRVELGLLSQEQMNKIDSIVDEGQRCLNDWYQSFKDPNIPKMDWFSHINDIMAKLSNFKTQTEKGNIQ